VAKDKNPAKGDKGNKGDKKNTSLRLESNTLKALKIRAIDEGTSVQAIVENLIDQYLSKKIKLSKTAK
jgi:hypothetical protein